MRKAILFTGTVLLIAAFAVEQAEAQSFIRKLKNKTEDAVIDKMFEDGKSEGDNATNPSSDSPANKKGGLEAESIDVNTYIAEAKTEFENKDYTGARYSIRQAILGIELEIGENILEGLPGEIAGLEVVSSADQVTSSGIGFVGLIIERTYSGGDQEFRVKIGNDAGMLSAASIYMTTSSYATTSGEEQNWKHTKFKDYKAIIEYDEYSGYKLSVPFGQSSILITEGVNFNSESEFMDASLAIDLDNIKKQLGEQ